MAHISDKLLHLAYGLRAGPVLISGKIVVSDTSGAINATTSYYESGVSAVRDSAGQYTITIPGVVSGVAVATVQEATHARTVRVQSLTVTNAVTTLILQVSSTGTTPAAADLTAAADAIHFMLLGSKTTVAANG